MEHILQASSVVSDGINILVVDDNSLHTITILKILKEFGLNANVANDGSEAVQRVQELYEKRQTTYRLIIIDYAMPVLSGIDATIMIRKYLSERVKPSEMPFICCLTSYKERSFKD